MEIPDSYVGWVFGLFGTLVAWLVRLEARLNARPTRKEQEVIAERVAEEVDLKFDEIKRMLEKQNEFTARDRQSTVEHRQWIGDSMAEIRTQVAVLRERLGEDALKSTGGMPRRRP